DEADLPVQAAVEGEVRTLWVDSVVRGVVHRDQERVLQAEVLGEVDPERRVTAVVLTDLDTVEVDLGTGVRTAHLQPGAAAPRAGRKLPGVGAPSAVVVVSAVLPVLGVPGVGEGHLLASGPDLVPGGGRRHLLTGERPPFGEPIDDSWACDVRAQRDSSDRTGARLLLVRLTARAFLW